MRLALALLLAVSGALVVDTAPARADDAVRPATGTVVDGRARFQVITPTLIRLECAADGRFEDRPTLALRLRTWDLRVLSVERPRVVTVDGERARTWTYDPDTRSLRIVLTRVPSRTGVTVRLR